MIKGFIKGEIENWHELDNYEKTDYIFYLSVLAFWILVLIICVIAQFAN